MTEPVIVIDQLHKAYHTVVAVDNVSFQVNQGEIFGLLGPNGAGKTTALSEMEQLFNLCSLVYHILPKLRI